MKLKNFKVGIGNVNCYLVTDEEGAGIIVDPGGGKDTILNYIEQEELNIKAIVLTHYHYDHILAVEDLQQELQVPVWIHEADAEGLLKPELNLSSSPSVPSVSIEADKLLQDGEKIKVGQLKLEIIHTPGHTPGGICIKIDDILLTGDTLFKGSVGRTDLTGGSYQQLADSISQKVMKLDDQLEVYPGHLGQSTLGRERKRNRIVKDMLKK
ncbi:MBL fold metallo-hydrolase [Natroniella sulfidigena]|uniref:MBL fold metallo-hydrolase n=1 Tax=Natroniella sulfidigena TaxID=723921 RepID=UPI00200AA381|nr:MBL fold metallo-hydrolase [Natroniella sulfidigena]MCK8816807.1 MBL fold metallo-hydrolase [Natroniella sulfidigena]